MRPITSTQSVLKNPLNELLGTESNVRLLRILCIDVEGSLSAPDIAERAGLSITGARKALSRLVSSGFVELVGGGRKQQYAFDSSRPLMKATMNLFLAEQQRYEEMIRSLRQVAQQIVPAPRSVWVHSFPLQLGDPLEINILGDSKLISTITSYARQEFAQIEQQFDITIEISGYTRADLPEVDVEKIALLAGAPPVSNATYTSGWEIKSHKDIDKRSEIWMGELISLIEEDPSIIRRARTYLEGLLTTNQGTADSDLKEWQKILESYPRHRLLRFLASSSPRACRLRQSNPFMAVLSPKDKTVLQHSRESINA